MRKNVLHSPRLSELKKRRRRVFINRILFVIFGVAVVLGSFTYLARISSLNIKSVEVKGNKIVDSGDISRVAQEQMVGKYLWLFPKTNILFYPKGKISTALEQNFTRLKDINIKVGGKSTLVVSTEERIPVYTWCGDTLEAENKECYFLDETGYVFDKAPYFSGDVYFKFYGPIDMSEDDNPTGHYFSKDSFNKLITLKEIISGMGLEPVSYYLKDDGETRMELSPPSGSAISPELIFNLEDEPTKIAENLESVLDTEPLHTDFKKKYASLMYIDLRFGNKVYYKFR